MDKLTKYIDKLTGTEKLFVPAHLLSPYPRYGSKLNEKLLEYLIDNTLTKINKYKISRWISHETNKIRAIDSIDNKYIEAKKTLIAEYRQSIDGKIVCILYNILESNFDLKERLIGFLRLEIDKVNKKYSGRLNKIIGQGGQLLTKTLKELDGDV